MVKGSSAVSTLVREDLSRRWRTILLIGVLAGLVAGVGLATVAGARRTSTLFGRHLDSSDGADVEIDPGQLQADSDAALRALPGVERAGWWASISAYPLTEEGRLDESQIGLLSMTSDGRYLDGEMDQVALLDGRRLDPDQRDEVMVTQGYADLIGVDIGDRIPIGWVRTDRDGFPQSDEPDARIDAEVVGIFALNEDIVAEELDSTIPRLFVSPAFTPPGPRWSTEYYDFAWYGLHLEDGTDGAEAAVEAWNDAVAEHNASIRVQDPGNPEGTEWIGFVRRVTDTQTKADRAVRPLVIALLATGAALLLTTAFLVAQALIRATRQDVERLRVVRMLGLDQGGLLRVLLAAPLVALVLAALVAVAVAVGLSGRFPVGPFTVLEPDPGTHADLVVLLPGLLLLVAVPLALVYVAGLHEVARVLQPARGDERPSRLAAVVGRSGAPEPVVAAVRLTVDPGRGASYVPVRSVLASTVVVVVVLVGGIVFAENLRALDERPERFGWRGDALMWADGGYGGFEPETADAWLAERDDIDGWRYLVGDGTRVDGRNVPGIAYGPGTGDAAAYEPEVTRGRAPVGAGEVVLGEATLEDLGLEVGDTVTLGSGEASREAEVVGTAVFPVFGPALAVRTGLDQGAWVAPDAGVFNFISNDGPPFNGLLLDTAPGADLQALAEEATGAPVLSDAFDADVFDVVEPTEVATTTDAIRFEPALLATLGVTGLLSILVTLMAVVRRRRPDLGLYRVLGFTPRQLRATIGTQGLLIAGAALVVGVPIGVALGRELWRRFADTLGTLEVSETAWGLVLLAAAAVLVVGLLSALPAAFLAGRRRSLAADRRE